MSVELSRHTKAFAVQGRMKLTTSAKSASLVTASLRNQEHLVIPCTMIVEGVLHSSNQAEPALALASEFGAIPQGWNGRPVVYTHPVEDGEAVSANRPAGWETEVIGQVFNTSLDDKSLESELWLDTSRTPQIVLDGLKENKVFEVSTGLFALAEEVGGVFNGHRYSQIWRNVVPDHLAILEPGTVGACSIADGCGTSQRNNVRKQGIYVNASTPIIAAPSNNCGGCPSKPVGPANEVMELGLSGKIPKVLRSFANKLSALFKSNELSDKDTRSAIQAGLDSMNDKIAYPEVHAVFDSYVIFMAMSREDYEWGLYKVSYSVEEGGSISIGGDMVKVRPETSYVPVVVSGEASAEPSTTAFNSSAKDHIVDISKEQLAELATLVASNLTTVNAALTAAAAEGAAALTANATADLASKAGQFKSIDEFVAACTPEISAQVKDAMAFTNSVRTGVVANLVKAGYKECELSGIPLTVLQRMSATASSLTSSASSALGTDFSGQAPGSLASNDTKDAFTPPMRTFEAAK